MMVVFPNYAAQREDDTVRLEPSHALLFDPLTSALPAVGVAAAVDVSSHRRANRRLTNDHVRFIPLANVHSSAGKLKKLIAYVRMQAGIFRTVRKSGFCYIYLPGHVGLGACIQCLLLRRPYGIYLRGEWSLFTPRTLQWVHSLVFRNAQFVLCTGVGLTKETARLNPRCECVVPMSSLLLKKPPSGPARSGTRASRVLFVGELVREKGVYELLDALALIEGREAGTASLSVVGVGPERASLERYVEQRGIAARVRFHGFIDDADRMAELYSTHDIFCLPTYTEGFPRVLYEAMSHGLPVVTTHVGQIGTVVRDNVNGLFVEVRSAEDVAEKITALIHDPLLRRRLGEGGGATMEGMLDGWRGSTHGDQVLRWLRQSGVELCAT